MRLFMTRALHMAVGLGFLFVAAPASCARAEAPPVEQWDIFEIALKGPADGNPFADVTVSARFTNGDVSKEVAGFYDGEGMYRIRFMPEGTGQWRYDTKSNRAELDARTGTLNVVKPSPKNHGPVRVANTFHFAYADGTPYKQIGTTCYSWIHQNNDKLEEKTLNTLAESPFNKLRMLVFPERTSPNPKAPAYYPFEGEPPKNWNFERFNPKFFEHLEERVGQLRDSGIEADLILFHPYDKGYYGFDRMGASADDRYLRYVVARLAAYRSVWWSLANEYDFIKTKTEADWDRLFQIIRQSDPYGHLRSIHNGAMIYNHTLPWVTHASIQNGSAAEDFGRAVLYRDAYRKPIVFDEIKYEGNVEQRWGQLSAEEMVLRFWEGTIAGTYVGHSEVFKDSGESRWLSSGGWLRGQSAPRLAFLRQILESGPAEGIDPIDKWQDLPCAGKPGEYYLFYFGHAQPTEWRFELPKIKITDGEKFRVDIIDTWNMTITPVDHVYKTTPFDGHFVRVEGEAVVKLPGTPYIALRIRRAE
jgi:hypothetical protein